MSVESTITPVSPSRRVRRSSLPARDEIDSAVSKAKRPETEMPWPTAPSLTPKSAAMTVSRLTGKNSDATMAKAQSDRAKTAPQWARDCSVACVRGGLSKDASQDWFIDYHRIKKLPRHRFTGCWGMKGYRLSRIPIRQRVYGRC